MCMYTKISFIRNYILDKNKLVSKDIVKYKSLCSALDVINDIDDSIYAYLNLSRTLGRGINYIYVYGIINALQSQTDAVKIVFKFFKEKDLNVNENKDLDIIRMIRNKIFAHSADYGNGFGIIASTLTTFSFQPNGFQIEYKDSAHNQLDLYSKIDLLSRNQYKGEHFTISIKQLIENHQLCLEKYLQDVIDSLNRE